jgi:aspartokinase/homoserine dehydrogenase 1
MPKGSTLIMKFGGTSVGSAEAVQQATNIIKQNRSDWDNLVVVASAMAGVTDMLLGAAHSAVDAKVNDVNAASYELRNIHLDVIEKLITRQEIKASTRIAIEKLLSDFENITTAMTILGEATPRGLDALLGIGERLSVRIICGVLRSIGVDAQFIDASQLIVTDNIYQAAHPDMIATKQSVDKVILPVLESRLVPIVTGFIAATQDGIPTTLGRGGSDYTAAIIGAVLDADDVWVWTDVDGVMTTDPRIVADAKTIRVLSFREIAELAYFGAKVVHPKTMRPVMDAGISIRVCNTFNPNHPGTRLVSENKQGTNGTIKAVTAIRGQSLITIEGRGMLGIPGVAARAFGSVAKTGTSVPLITQASSEQSICFAVPFEAKEQVVYSLENEFSHEIAKRDIDRVWGTTPVVIITIVGFGMRSTPGIAGKIFNALGMRNVNVIAIAQGSSEVSISLVVDAKDADEGVRAVHELIDIQPS